MKFAHCVKATYNGSEFLVFPHCVILFLLLEHNLQASKSENADLASQLLDVQDQMDNMNEDYERLKNVEVQYDSLKLKLDFMESEKQVTQDYENFQNLNHDMQEEIISLRSYINQQQMVNSALQQQIQTSGKILYSIEISEFFCHLTFT